MSQTFSQYKVQRISFPPRSKMSLKLKGPKRPAGDSQPESKASSPMRAASGGPKLKLTFSQPATPVEQTGGFPEGHQPRKKLSITTLNTKRPPPPRPHGVGYDSEESDREEDPAIQQGVILRMQPGPDAELVRAAISNNKIGSKEELGVDVGLRFLTSDFRRATLRVQNRLYAAVLVDLPCIIESMKSWDRKGWWKVADIHQMLLVLGRVQSDEEAKIYPLPREVDSEKMQYPHGLTPPMRYVRQRRFRKRMGNKQVENVEDEVERLLREDDEWESKYKDAKITLKEFTPAEYERHMEVEDMEMDNVVQSPDAIDEENEDEDDVAFQHDLEAAFAEAADPHAGAESPLVSATGFDSPVAFADGDIAMAETPVETSTPMHDEESESESEEDDYDDEDEDAAAQAAEKAQQLEEVADLEREIEAAKVKANTMTNQLLKRREMEKIAKLGDDLRMKKATYGLDDD
ncbi:hypothetical protein K470DRAFT_300455 [Piedraia hortae CBS 480.64]|uniref:TAFII55 protein conserved region domain-containing protein n=1 Tax=Piedraia hortae CBS 480.64 TaxID=1314780 RepID=A0A6A7BWJ2_9PEZI|nr:hypothetical protein K470DRAFT_300455 [Piedraia hortae CBS 480.64]